jgi:hypothetical protein
LNFLIKIEEALDKIILAILAQIKGWTPEPFYMVYDWFLSIPIHLKKTKEKWIPKLRIHYLKLLGYTEHYTTMIRGHFVGLLIYLRSEEFKNKDKKEMVIAPLRKFKTDPVKAFSVTILIAFFGFAGQLIYKSAEKIVVGTYALRKPASSRDDVEPLMEFRKVKYTTHLASGEEAEVMFNIDIVAKSHEDLDVMMKQEEKVLEHVEKFPVQVAELPLKDENKKTLEEAMIASLKHEFHFNAIKSLSIKQVLEGRPKYFMQTEKLFKFENLDLQLFLEDTRRNRQIYIDFTALTSNRYVVIYLKEHIVEIRDHINLNVEPVIPRLPIEDEGRQIIKDKIKWEINEYLKKEGVEGKILEIYVEHLIAS